MVHGLRRVLAAALVSLAAPAFATPQPRDATDLWFNPAESGWGLNIFHQGDTLFASLFVYGPDGQPKWYTGSQLSGGPTVFSGVLAEASGPYFGAATLDPNAVTRRAVGTMTFTLGDPTSTVDYAIDGVRVTKQVSRLTFQPTSLAAPYVGYLYQPGSAGGEVRREEILSISDDGSNVLMTTLDAGQSCTWSGTHAQDGQYEKLSGTYACGASTGTWSMTADPTTSGFTGTLSGNGIDGRIAAARRGSSAMRGPGWRNDLYFPANEGGWGLNIIEQGTASTTKIFATLFVYDAQGRPRWYSVSDLARHDFAGDVTYYMGAVVESTGPYYGTAFNPAGVTRRVVGSMLFTTYDDDRPARLSYSIDGVSVAKDVTRFGFRKNDFSGSYAGHITREADNSYEAVSVVIADAGAGFTMRTTSASRSCDYTSPAFAQSGHLRLMSGTYSCSNGASGTFVLRNATVSGQGFTAKYELDGRGFGHIAGVRLGG